MKIKSISHMTFICKDIEKSGLFLETIFNAKEIYDSKNKNYSISREKFFLINDLWVVLMEGESIEMTYNHIAFEVDEIELPLFEEEIKKLGLTILSSRPRDPREGKSLYFYDYDNHLFELHTGSLTTRLQYYFE